MIDSPLGPIAIGATESGVSSIGFDRGTGFEPVDGNGVHIAERASVQLREYSAGARTDFDLPLDPVGTPFQRAVWDELMRIPLGETRSYRDVAQAIGKPDAVRAVGMANGRNPIVIVVPCHRVIGADGALRGYGGEVWRKEWLLAREGAIAPGGGLFASAT